MQKSEVLASRKAFSRPWHSPPRWPDETKTLFHLSAACYNHAHLIGESTERMNAFSQELWKILRDAGKGIHAWCVLTNHYHLLIETMDLKTTIRELGKLHGRTSRIWNLENNTLGRKCFHRICDRAIRSDRHYWATLNYIHHNPVRHGYVSTWTEWLWSSAQDYLQNMGRDEAIRVWKEYPVLEYGDKWDTDLESSPHVVPRLRGTDSHSSPSPPPQKPPTSA